MKRYAFLVLACVGIAACAPYESGQPPPTPGVCQIEPYDPIQGNRVSSELQQKAQSMTGATSVRVIRPGQAITREYDAGRLNLQLDSADVVVRAYCG